MTIFLRVDNFDAMPDGGPMDYQANHRGFDIGRDSHLDWCLKDPDRHISGKHCEVRFENGGYALYDVSTNGTFLNGASDRVKSPHMLQDGDRLTIGQYVISVRVVGLAEQPAAQQAPAAPQAPSQQQDPYAGDWTPAHQPSAFESDDIWASDSAAPAPIDRRDLIPPKQRGPREAGFESQYVDLPQTFENPQTFGTPQPFATPDPYATPQGFPGNPDVAPPSPFAEPQAVPQSFPVDQGAVPPSPFSAPQVPPAPPSNEPAGPIEGRSTDAPAIPTPVTPTPAIPTPGAPAQPVSASPFLPEQNDTVSERPFPVAPVPDPVPQEDQGGNQSAGPNPHHETNGDTPPFPVGPDSPPAQPGNAESEEIGDPEVEKSETGKPEPVGFASMGGESEPFTSQIPHLMAAPLPTVSVPPQGSAIVPSTPSPEPPAIPIDSAPAGPAPLGSAPLGSAPVGSAPVGSAMSAPQAVGVQPAGAPGTGEFVQHFARGAKINPADLSHLDPAALAEDLGAVVRIMVEHLAVLLAARAKAKKITKSANRTMLVADGNNPLKFLPTPDEMLTVMFARSRRGFKDAQGSVTEAFGDLEKHEFATIFAMQKALGKLLEDMSPEAIESDIAKSVFSSRQAKAWELYVQRWDEKSDPHENGILDVFLEHFSEFYDQQK